MPVEQQCFHQWWGPECRMASSGIRAHHAVSSFASTPLPAAA
jgi:hypothetical protein